MLLLYKSINFLSDFLFHSCLIFLIFFVNFVFGFFVVSGKMNKLLLTDTDSRFSRLHLYAPFEMKHNKIYYNVYSYNTRHVFIKVRSSRFVFLYFWAGLVLYFLISSFSFFGFSFPPINYNSFSLYNFNNLSAVSAKSLKSELFNLTVATFESKSCINCINFQLTFNVDVTFLYHIFKKNKTKKMYFHFHLKRLMTNVRIIFAE